MNPFPFRGLREEPILHPLVLNTFDIQQYDVIVTMLKYN